MPDELWTEVHDIVQEIGIKTITMEKKCKKAKCLSEEALQINVKKISYNNNYDRFTALEFSRTRMCLPSMTAAGVPWLSHVQFFATS